MPAKLVLRPGWLIRAHENQQFGVLYPATVDSQVEGRHAIAVLNALVRALAQQAACDFVCSIQEAVVQGRPAVLVLRLQQSLTVGRMAACLHAAPASVRTASMQAAKGTIIDV